MLFALTLIAALTCGLVGGIFFAFSTFVMSGLARIPAEVGIRAMQSINVTVLNGWFLTVFFGGGVVCVVLLIYAVTIGNHGRALFLAAGSVLYIVGSIIVTIVFNVPKNKRLAEVSANDPNSEQRWRDYVSSWTAWNHVRTIASVAAAALFVIALATWT